MAKRLLALVSLVVLVFSSLLVSAPARADVTFSTGCNSSLGDCPSIQIIPAGPDGISQEVALVDLNNTDFCAAEIGAEDLSGVTVVDLSGTGGYSFRDQSSGTTGSHIGTVSFAHAGTYSLGFRVQCAYSSAFIGTYIIEGGVDATFTISVPAPTATPTATPTPTPSPSSSALGQVQNVKVTPRDDGADLTWDPVPRATSYVVWHSGIWACQGVATSCSVSGLTYGSLESQIAVQAFTSNSSDTPTTVPPFRVAQQIALSGYLSGKMQVGSTLKFVPVTSGTVAHTDLQWFSCSAPVASSQSQPNCDQIANASGDSLTVSSAFLGKYLTPFIHANSPWSDAMFTLGSSKAVVSASAPAPVTPGDQGGKPTVTEISNHQVTNAGGTVITVSGSNLSGVVAVALNGVAAKFTPVSDTSLSFTVPASSTSVGLVDLTLVNTKGSTTLSKVINYTKAHTVAYPSLKLMVPGFATGKFALTSAQKKAVAKFIGSKPDYLKLTCTGSTTGLAKSTALLSLDLKRAKAVCAFATSLNKSVMSMSNFVSGAKAGKVSQFVALTLNH